jgi:hypothetical protein
MRNCPGFLLLVLTVNNSAALVMLLEQHQFYSLVSVVTKNYKFSTGTLKIAIFLSQRPNFVAMKQQKNHIVVNTGADFFLFVTHFTVHLKQSTGFRWFVTSYNVAHTFQDRY